MSELDDLTTSVNAEVTVEASALALINGFAAKLQAAIDAGNPAALTALKDQIDASSADLAAAVTANTPAA